MKEMVTRRNFLKLSGGAVAGAYVLALSGCGSQGASEPSGNSSNSGETITWRLTGYAAEDHWLTRTYRWWAEEIDKRTNGQLKIEIYPNGSLPYEQSEALTSVDQGLVEVAEVWGGSLGGAEQALEVVDLPGFVPPDMQLRSELQNRLKEPLNEIVNQNYDADIYSFVQLEPRNIYSKPTIPDLSALAGKQIRAIGAMESNFTEALGASPVAMSFPDTYLAMQQGVIGGLWIVDSAIYTSNMYEVSDYIIDLQVGGASTYLTINRSAFESLPPDVQQVLDELEPEYQEQAESNLLDDLEVNREALLDEGMEVISWPQEDMERMQSLAEDLQQDWYADAGPDAQRIFDQAEQFIQDEGTS